MSPDQPLQGPKSRRGVGLPVSPGSSVTKASLCFLLTPYTAWGSGSGLQDTLTSLGPHWFPECSWVETCRTALSGRQRPMAGRSWGLLTSRGCQCHLGAHLADVPPVPPAPDRRGLQGHGHLHRVLHHPAGLRQLPPLPVTQPALPTQGRAPPAPPSLPGAQPGRPHREAGRWRALPLTFPRPPAGWPGPRRGEGPRGQLCVGFRELHGGESGFQNAGPASRGIGGLHPSGGWTLHPQGGGSWPRSGCGYMCGLGTSRRTKATDVPELSLPPLPHPGHTLR